MELRMYSLVLYQLTGIQAGIQSGHANVEYGVESKFDGRWLDWAINWKTVIVLNGGSSSTLTSAIIALQENDIEHSIFVEPDLYNNVSAISFLVDERVFNKTLYPDFQINDDETHEEMELRYDEWVESIGGKENAFLREWLPRFRLA